jgi:hypothetical protein
LHEENAVLIGSVRSLRKQLSAHGSKV